MKFGCTVEMVRLNLDFKFTVLNNCTSVLSCFFFFMLLWLCLAFLFQGPYSRRTLTEEMFAARFKETSTVFTFTLIQPRPRVLSQHVWVWGWFQKRTVMYYYFAQFLYKFKILCFILFFAEFGSDSACIYSMHTSLPRFAESVGLTTRAEVSRSGVTSCCD